MSIAINPDTNRIYVTNSGSGNVSVIDGNTDDVVATVPVGDLPYTITVNRASNKIYVSRTFSDVTVIIDGRTNVPATVKAGVGDAVAAESLESRTYMTSFESSRVVVFDGGRDQTSTIETPDHMWAMAADPATKKLYAVSMGASKVTIIDANSHTKEVRAGEIPCAIAVDGSLGKAYIANFASGDLSVIDGATDALAVSVKVGPKPQAIAVDSSNHKVYVASMHDRTVTVVDGANNAVLGIVRLQKPPFSIAVNSKTHVAVALSLYGDVMLIDGTRLTASLVSIPKDGH